MMTETTKESVVIFSHTFTNPINWGDFKVEDYVSYYHYQDCCESVYIDFDHVESQRDEMTRLWIIKKMEIATAPWDGIILNLYNWENDGFSDTRVSIFLACRNQQNWYYNDELKLIVSVEWVKFEQELQEIDCVENDID